MQSAAKGSGASNVVGVAKGNAASLQSPATARKTSQHQSIKLKHQVDQSINLKKSVSAQQRTAPKDKGTEIQPTIVKKKRPSTRAPTNGLLAPQSRCFPMSTPNLTLLLLRLAVRVYGKEYFKTTPSEWTGVHGRGSSWVCPICPPPPPHLLSAAHTLHTLLLPIAILYRCATSANPGQPYLESPYCRAPWALPSDAGIQHALSPHLASMPAPCARVAASLPCVCVMRDARACI